MMKRSKKWKSCGKPKNCSRQLPTDQIRFGLSFTAGMATEYLISIPLELVISFFAEEYLSLSESLHHLVKMAGFNPTFCHNSQIILRKKLLRWTVLLLGFIPLLSCPHSLFKVSVLARKANIWQLSPTKKQAPHFRCVL